MIVYKCDECNSINEEQTKCSNNIKDVPLGWITLDINFYNNNKHTVTGVRLIQTENQLKHFCSNDCFKNYFFWKETKIPRGK
jgi:hypothetical protein